MFTIIATDHANKTYDIRESEKSYNDLIEALIPFMNKGIAILIIENDKIIFNNTPTLSRTIAHNDQTIFSLSYVSPSSLPLPSPEVLESLSPLSPDHIHDNPTYNSPNIESAEYVGKLPGYKFFHVHVYYANCENPVDFPFNYEESALDFYCNL